MSDSIASAVSVTASGKPQQNSKWLTWFYGVNLGLIVAFIALLISS